VDIIGQEAVAQAGKRLARTPLRRSDNCTFASVGVAPRSHHRLIPPLVGCVHKIRYMNPVITVADSLAILRCFASLFDS
jgi:hypothetical protein